jgi:hypothetical protein|tara:strand:- start:2110 stop:2694 length:585 start_codon:yes stop_codon:yes gene_type:complete
MGRLDNYEQVDARLKRVHGQSNKVRIHTEIQAHSENWDRVVVKASLYEGDILLATGIAMDWKDKDRNANRTNWVEVAETSAIGRAIANSKFQDPDAKRPSREEMEVAEGRNEVAAPKEVAPKEAVTMNGNGSRSQLVKLMADHKLTDSVVDKFFGQRGWINNGQTWTDASPDKLDQIYGRAKENPEGFVSAIAA